MKPRSIRFRLTALYTAIMAATLAVAGIGVLLAIRGSVEETVDYDLRSRLGALRGYLDRQIRQEGVSELANELDEQAATGQAGPFIRIADKGGKWIYRSPETKDWDPSLPAAASLKEKGRAQTVRFRGRPLRVLSAPFPIGIVQIALPMNEFAEMEDKFILDMALASPLLLLLAAAGGYWMSARALQPVDQLAKTARGIGARNLSERLPLRGTGDELDRLSATLNEMLARLETAFGKITRFTADASHELRTPVAIMRTTAEVIRTRPRTEEEHRKGWGEIVTQAERTSALIDDLLLLARADAGSGDLIFEPMDLGATLSDVCREMQIMADAAGLRLIAPEPPECRIMGDPAAIRRLFLILLDNAVKYTREGGEIHVRMQVGANAATIEVRDTGVGISPEDLPSVFDRFYRTSRDRSRRTGGAGLGLAIGQWIANRHGGKITAESKPGEGSIFRVIVPARKLFMSSSESIGIIESKGDIP